LEEEQMNKVELVGRLTKDVELKTTSNQTSYCNFTIAVDRRFKDANGERQTDFINCVAWRQTAEFIGKYFHKGNRIGVCGSIQTRSYEKDGQKVFVTEVLVDEAEFVESQSKTESAPTPQAEPTPVTEESGSLPFEI
jgi:single-strand DNA-binding protein